MENNIIKKNNKIVFKYNNFKRYLISLSFIVFIFLGINFIFIGHWFSISLGIILTITGAHNLIDILFFKSLTFENKFVTKKWFIFGEKKVKIDDLKIGVSKRIWTGIITFSDKNKNFLSNSLMVFELFPIGNKGFKEIKKILIDKKVIKGTENEWSD